MVCASRREATKPYILSFETCWENPRNRDSQDFRKIGNTKLSQRGEKITRSGFFIAPSPPYSNRG